MKQAIICFGASKLGMIAKNYLGNKYNIIGFCDNDPNKWGSHLEGLPVFSPRDLKHLNTRVLITSTHHQEISKQLIAMGVTEFEVLTISVKPGGKPALQTNEDIVFRDEQFLEIYTQIKKYTMTSFERIYALYQAVKYIAANAIPGDFVECGVWRGGSAMVMALTLKALNITDRAIYLYDTFTGMTEPTDFDVDLNGIGAKEQLNDVACYASLAEVKQNLYSTGYPNEKLFFIKGPVEKTIPATIPESISLLRLDTDWYESTYHELIHLYPILVHQGVLCIDDYGHWGGARKAIDQYFTENKVHILLNRVDYTGRIGIKTNSKIGE